MFVEIWENLVKRNGYGITPKEIINVELNK